MRIPKIQIGYNFNDKLNWNMHVERGGKCLIIKIFLHGLVQYAYFCFVTCFFFLENIYFVWKLLQTCLAKTNKNIICF